MKIPHHRLHLIDPSQKSKRRQRGSAIAEFGPALFFIFIFGLFPVIDIIALSFNYTSLMSLNDIQLREAVKLPKSIATNPKGPVVGSIPDKWMATVLGGAANLEERPATSVGYDASSGNMYVQVSTTVSLRPLLNIPFFYKVPGIGAPVSFTVSSSRLIENPMFAVQ
ncbi:hypothetical protein BH11CYA1_BH11CYA1_42350 [soil metagenome]